MKISKSLLSAIAAGIVMTAATSCDKSEVIDSERATTEATEGERGNETNPTWCGNGNNSDNCPACGMG